MNIKGMGNVRAIESYQNVSRKQNVSNVNKVAKDRIELSSEGKALSDYSISKNEYDKSFKIEELKQKIKSGTYNVDAKQTANAIIKSMKEK